MSTLMTQIFEGDCTQILQLETIQDVALTFLDPPFNQNKDYALHHDNLPNDAYWQWMTALCSRIRALTLSGGAIYFMQREKNSEYVLRCLRESGWTFQNLIIWKKLTSAVPSTQRYGKHYQIIAYATNGKVPRVFNRLRITPPLPAHYKYERENGMFVTDIWDDIRELTSGYFAGDEAIRSADGTRQHKQQAPIALLLRMLLTSTRPHDRVLDPFAGTGTTLVTARQLGREALGVEIDPANIEMIRSRLAVLRTPDNIDSYRSDYRHTPDLEAIWLSPTLIGVEDVQPNDLLDLPLFRASSNE